MNRNIVAHIGQRNRLLLGKPLIHPENLTKMSSPLSFLWDFPSLSKRSTLRDRSTQLLLMKNLRDCKAQTIEIKQSFL